MKNITNYFSKIIYVLIACAYTKLVLDIVLQDFIGRATGTVLWRILQWLLISTAFFVTGLLIYKKHLFIEKHANKIVYIYIIVLFCAQVLLGNELRVIPKYDFSAIYHGAIDWLVTGTFEQFYEYYYYYPNNLGPMFFLMMLFQVASKVGIFDFYMIGIIVNCLMNGLMVWLTYVLCKRFFSISQAMMAVLLYAIYPPMYLLGAVFYTDQLTMMFPVALIIVFYIMRQKSDSISIIGWSVLISVICIAGYMLKPTVLIVWIAILCVLFLDRKWKHLLTLLVSFLLIFFVTHLGFDNYIYSNHLNEEKAQMMNTPTETWILMGLNDNPGFSPEDTEFSRAIINPAERKEVVRNEIKNRIKSYGVIDLIEHLERKGVMAFGDGTFELSYTFLFGFENDTKFEKSITLLGENYHKYWELCSAIWYVMLFYSVYGMIHDAYSAIKKQNVDLRNMVISLSVFGLLCFLLMWEIHSRYIVNYFSCFVLLATNGITKLLQRDNRTQMD
ncbi:MAG: glycosyltransferase family 39 protein [Lachnospiraceae bacterium]|nr:glycosyltransferase family 39 protein [Lachnospiraceae bacterium]